MVVFELTNSEDGALVFEVEDNFVSGYETQCRGAVFFKTTNISNLKEVQSYLERYLASVNLEIERQSKL